ncbi:FMN-binding domain-containing protein [Mesorhizobium sp. SARCC-RB16n]|uniref:FMN-binding protein n=1 Tax=Mesorhizobium sp. SARCC-RB16n TaxID=2116687 RepID=UPI00122F2273|nr:FMN-binding protein [Mesorhizobium sp. SARCC-RB16n]KAA3442004.1 FMN-binding domain-containing protein [Mesorhizobium sp. SARCC-RB16n]
MKKIALSLFVIASSGAYVWEQAGKVPSGDAIDTAGPANTAVETVQQLVGPAPAPAAVIAAPATPPLAIRQVEPWATPPAKVGIETTAAIAAPISKLSAVAEPTVAEKSPLAVGRPQASVAPAPPAKQMPAERVADATPQTATFAATPAVYIPIPQPRPDYPQPTVRIIKAGMKPSVNSGMKTVGHGFADGTYAGPVADAYYGLIQIQASIQGGRLTSLKVLKYPNDRRTSVNINRQALPMLRDEAISAQSANVDIISGATLTSRAFRQSLAGALKQASS